MVMVTGQLVTMKVKIMKQEGCKLKMITFKKAKMLTTQ